MTAPSSCCSASPTSRRSFSWSLQDNERLVIEIGRIIRQDFLQQNGFDPVDASCSMSKAYGMLQMMIKLYDVAREALESGATVDDVLKNPVIEKISRSRYVPEDEFPAYQQDVMAELEKGFAVPA